MSLEHSYRQLISDLESVKQRRGIDYSLEKFASFLSLIGNPHLCLPTVYHIAGTNGKGSTVALLAGAFRKLGYSVGTFTSPHLFDYTERLTFNLSPISQKEFMRVFCPLLEKKSLVATEFELLTAGAFLWFSEKKPDIVIIETGLGGRLDATNVVTPHCSIITSLGFDHQDILGSSMEKIAYEKAGIIKEGRPVITISSQPPEGLGVIRRISQEKNAPLTIVDPLDTIPESFPLKGNFQKENAALALYGIKQFVSKKDCSLSLFSDVQHPGRCHIIKKDNQIWVFDGAHNVDALRSIFDTVVMLFPNTPIVCAMGVLKTKDIRQMMAIVSRFTRHVYWSNFWPGTSESSDVIRSFLPKSVSITDIDSLEDVPKSHSIVLVTGSLYFLGTVLEECVMQRDH
jgi:dihydrofolate synthase/folylpolyglutamate synthase